MRRIPLDYCIGRESPVHHMPAVAKLVAALVVVMGTALMPRTQAWSLAAVAGVLVLVIMLSRLPLIRIMARVLIVEPFVAGVALLSLLQPHGLGIFLGLITKSTLCIMAMMILTGTTPFSDLLDALRRLRVPGILVTTLALMYRYLFLLLDELERMRKARTSRTFSKRRFQLWHALSTTAAQLFIRTSLRAEHVYAAMCARGWRS
jgi:cobalt/nickel transport system permease protein